MGYCNGISVFVDAFKMCLGGKSQTAAHTTAPLTQSSLNTENRSVSIYYANFRDKIKVVFISTYRHVYTASLMFIGPCIIVIVGE